MPELDASRFHRLYGPASMRISYKKSDFLDYLVMILASAAVIHFSFRSEPLLEGLGLGLCLFLGVTFPLRHGVQWRVPTILRAPQELLFTVIYRVQNISWIFLVATAVLVADNLFIAATPDLPHHTELMRKIAVGLFFTHFAVISLYRTVILAAHLRRRELVREILMQTFWKKTLLAQPNVALHLIHAYVTGLLTHLVLIAPWYILITHVRYSAISVAVISIVNLVIHFFHLRRFPNWFYREHWLGHATEFDFIYIHGTHHDAVPCGLIGVAGNGVLEGFARDVVGNPLALYSPLTAFLGHSLEVLQDIKAHQYIPGIYPRLPRWFHEVSQHSTHHFGRLEPFSIALRLRPNSELLKTRRINFPPVEILNSVELDETLGGFHWDNPRYQRFLALYDKYQPTEAE